MFKTVTDLVKGKKKFLKLFLLIKKIKGDISLAQARKMFYNLVCLPILGKQSNLLRPCAKLKSNILKLESYKNLPQHDKYHLKKSPHPSAHHYVVSFRVALCVSARVNH